MANRVRGDERRGEDGDEGRGNNVRVVQIENAYFDKLRERLNQGGDGGSAGAPTAEQDEKRVPGFVIYGDDGRPI